ncbi:hypothetical protein AMECASPLE_032347 [Ameca splendens]|uniref:Uncharacterized protein n=1 Tax=Ameca splendens TaxID=208324 RepID=A0ABV0ZGN9_9TELE
MAPFLCESQTSLEFQIRSVCSAGLWMILVLSQSKMCFFNLQWSAIITGKFKISDSGLLQTENHFMEWERAKIICMENSKHQSWIMEAVEIRKQAHTAMNWGKRGFQLSFTWNDILQ